MSNGWGSSWGASVSSGAATPTGVYPVITPPTIEPVSREDMLVHLQNVPADQYELVDALTSAAREWVEGFTGRTLVDTLLEAAFPDYPVYGSYNNYYRYDGYYSRYSGNSVTIPNGVNPYSIGVALPRPPIIEIVSFYTTDSDGVATLLAADQYTLDNTNILAPRVIPAYGKTWPATRYQPSSLRIRYRAGYATPGSPDERHLIPASLRSAIKLIVGHLYEHRETVADGQPLHEVPMGAEWLCRPYRVNLGFA